jgi:hypothetical protein
MNRTGAFHQFIENYGIQASTISFHAGTPFVYRES